MSLISRFKFIVFILLFSFNLFFISACQAQLSESDHQVTITVWHGINPPENRDVFAELVTKFNQSQNQVKVEQFYIGQPDQQIPKILTAIVGNQPPDILWYVPQITGQLVEMGAILPLEDWLNNSPIKAEIDSAMFSCMELDNHIYSIPFATNNTAVFYRPSLFKEAGIEQLPRTWDEFSQVAEKLTQDVNGDGVIDRYGVLLSLGKGEWTTFVWLPFIYSAEGELLAAGKPNLVNEGTINALEFGGDLVKRGVAMLSAPDRGYELDNFIADNVAMQITGPWTLGQLASVGIDYGVFPIPIAKKPASVIGGENLFVFKTNSEQENAATKFLEYVLGEEFQTTWALKTGYLPINLKSQTGEAYQTFIQENPVLKIFLGQMKWAKSRPLIPGYVNLSENLGRAIEATLLEKSEAKQALEASQKRLDLMIK